MLLERERERRNLVFNGFFKLLKEAADLVGVRLFEIEWKSLKECTKNIKNIIWEKEKEYIYIDLSSVDIETNSIIEIRKINKNNAPSRAKQVIFTDDVIFGTTRPMLKRVSMITKEYDNQICSTGFCVLRADKNIILPKWIYYNMFKENFYIFIEQYSKGASYPSISDKDVKNFKIPVPSIEVQKYIVEKLDKFDKLVNDIKEGLPKEMELRQKQYEYYREKLLKFEK